MKLRLPIDLGRWQCVEPILDQALELPTGEQRAFLDQTCAGEVDREQTENRPDTSRSPCAAEAVERVPDSNGRREQMRKLSDDRIDKRLLGIVLAMPGFFHRDQKGAVNSE